MNHKELEVWKRSVDLVIKIYDICSDLPKDEKYGLISQMKRAVISIPSNIAGGCAKRVNKRMRSVFRHSEWFSKRIGNTVNNY